MAQQTLLQNMTMLTLRVQAILEKVNALDARVSASSGEGLSGIREEIRRDVSKERAMMEASMEHRIDQQVGRLLADKDNSAAITRLERRLDSVIERLAKLELLRSETETIAA
jgi:hypothetical protein